MAAMSSGELAGSLGADFMPHEIIVCPGEDVADKISSFIYERRQSQTINVLSGTGSVTNVHIRNVRGSIKLPGDFKILSLYGDFIPISFEGKGGIIKFCLKGELEAADGTEIKGEFSGMEALSPVQVVVGGSITSFEVSSASSTIINSELTAAMKSCDLARSSGADFPPHEIIVCPGEDVVETIESFTRDRRQTIHVLSGTGSITNIRLKRDGGRRFISRVSRGEYKILSLSGEFIPISFEGTGYIMKFFLQATLEAADGTEIKDYFTLMKAVSPVQLAALSQELLHEPLDLFLLLLQKTRLSAFQFKNECDHQTFEGFPKPFKVI